MKTKQLLILIGLIALIMVFQPALVRADVPAAVNYLQTHDQNPWVTQALVAAGANIVDISHLTDVEDIENPTSNDYAKTILALAAVGENLETFGDIDDIDYVAKLRNYVAKLKTYYQDGQMGDESLLNDDIWAILAFASVYEVDFAEAIGVYLKGQQNDDGGWGWAVGGDSDTNDTAAAIMALIEAGVDTDNEVITKAISKDISYLQTMQNDDGGFLNNPMWGTDSDSGSDAWVISALYKVVQDPNSWVKNDGNPITHLQSLQDINNEDSDGGFWWVKPGTSEWNNKAMTAYAVIALSGKSYPVGYYQIPLPPTSHLVIKGQDGIICDTDVSGWTALEIVENAAGICDYAYNDIAEEGSMIGWLYYVNTELPMIDANDYVLSQGDEVLWYYGEWGWDNIVLEEGNSKVAVTAHQPISIPMSITVPSTVTDATINISALKTDNGDETTATLPEITLNVTTNLSATPVEVIIPADTVITAITAPASWDGIINVPRIEANDSVVVEADSGYTAEVCSVIEIGCGNTEILFNKAVRILIPGAAGKLVGYSRGGNFTKITAICSPGGDALDAGGDCTIDSNDDLVIWTKHFTKFVTYTQTAIPPVIPQTTQSGGSTFFPATDCQSVEYDEWQDTCVDGWQYRNVLSEIPTNCKLTAEQENQRKRQCIKDVGEETIEEEPIVEVLGVEFILDDQETKEETDRISNTENSGSIIINKAELIASGDVNQVILAMNVKRDLTAEVNYNKTIVAKVIADSGITAHERNSITNFVAYGTDDTMALGAGERAGAVNSYRSAFGKLPATEAEWNDCLKIANGYLPDQTNADAENKAAEIFKRIYLRDADRFNANDDLAVKIMAYGLRPADRDLDKEKAGLKIFQGVYGYNPFSATDWDYVRAIAYSGAIR